MIYKESLEKSNEYRKDYFETLSLFIKKLHSEAEKTRKEHWEIMRDNQEKYRQELIEMLGRPLTNISKEIPLAKKVLVTKEDNMSVYRIQLELPIGVKFYGIYFEHNDKKNLPLVISQHGGGGTCELCSDFLPTGTSNYNDMTMRIFRKGVNVFAPQLLLWRSDVDGAAYEREKIDAKLKQVGSSITAVEVYALIKSIDYFTEKESVDKDRIGMIGLSYGGFYTLFTAAIDTRIKAAVSSCFYNDRYRYSWVDWVWHNSAYKFFDNEVASLIYPRHLSIEVGRQDEFFSADTAKSEFENLINTIDDHSWIDFKAFEGTHEFCKDDENIEKLIKILLK